jgi:hypothetical protein
MRPRKLTWACLTAAGVLLSGARAQAQFMGLGDWSASARLRTEVARNDSQNGALAVNTHSTLLEERFTLKTAGVYVYDPRLLALSLEGTGALVQNWAMALGAPSRWTGALWGYDVSGRLLAQKPLSVLAYANRGESILAPTISAGTDYVAERRGVTLLANRLFVPSTLAYRQEATRQELLGSGPGVRRDELKNIVQYEGQRGWTDSQVDLGYTFTDSWDRAHHDLSFRRHEANFNYGTDFGAALDWHFDSRIRGMTQAGTLSQKRLTGDEILRVELTEALQGQARYLVTRFISPAGASTGHSGEVQLRHQLYESLTTTMSLDGTLEQITGGRTLTYGGRATANYTKRLPKSGMFQVGLMGAIHYSDARLPSNRVQVLQEMLTFGVPFANAMALRFPGVYLSSIRIIKVARGPLPPGCPELPDGPLELHPGEDFDLRAADSQDPAAASTGITEVFPRPCGVVRNPNAEQGRLEYSPGINPGDTIAVDYEYQYAPSLAYTTGAWRVDVGVDYGWIRPYYYHDQSDQHAVSGDGQYLDNKRTDTAGVEFRYTPGEQLRSSLFVEAKRFSSERQGRFDSVRCAQVVTWYPILDTMVSLTGDQTLIDYVEPRHRIENLSARVSASYTGLEGLVADAMTGALFSWDSIPPDAHTKERTIDATLRARWVLNMLELNAVATYYHRFREPWVDPRAFQGTLNVLGNPAGVDLREFRATLNILRKF